MEQKYHPKLNFNTSLIILQPVEEMLQALTKLRWERVDVKFNGWKQRFLAHNTILVVSNSFYKSQMNSVIVGLQFGYAALTLFVLLIPCLGKKFKSIFRWG